MQSATKTETLTSLEAMDNTQKDLDSNQYLTFIMAGEEYGVDILCVQEIRGWENATPLPNAPSQIKGVINLRGAIVPIIDLRQCFGLQAIDTTPVTVVIVIKVQMEDASRIVGILVDAVSDVYSLAKNDMRPAPNLGHSINTDFIHGLADVNGKMVILLDIDKLLLLEDQPNIAKISEHLAQINLDAPPEENC